MAADTLDLKEEEVDEALGEMKLEEQGPSTATTNGSSLPSHTPNGFKKSASATPELSKSEPQSPTARTSASQTPESEEDEEESIAGDITVLVAPGEALKLSRKSSQKAISRPAALFDHLPDVTIEATDVFQIIKDCIYGSKYMGYSEHDALDCDCSEEWRDGANHACGEDSDCINRATKMECVDEDCNCGRGCQNQRFQRKQYADVSVIKTEKKGYGLRVNTDLQPNDFIFEYVGEVINEPTFRRRTIQYDDEGIKHFYFMSLTKSEFVDATKKGNLGRFCNHSCNPNCYVDKWVVGEKLRMGIFAERHIKAGEELVFNYNVDRYGADPQPCYCAEPNCTGYIGGKTQTERATKLSHATIEALGIDDGDGWDTAVAKKPRKKKTGEDDEEYVNNVQPRGLDEEGVRKVMATLMQCKEKWIAVKLLDRIQRCGDDKVRNRVVQMHGYQILRSTLTTWREDNNVVLQILDILYKFPRLTRNKISDSKIEPTVQALVDSEHHDVAFEAKRLIEEWSKLEVAYRIPRKKFDPTAVPIFERRNTEPAQPAKETAVSTPTGPRGTGPQRSYASSRPPPIRRPFNSLPPGWFTAMDAKGNPYYYSKTGETQWKKPTHPAPEPPPPPKLPPKSVQTAKALQDIIDSITKPEPSSQTPSQSAQPSSTSTPTRDKKKSEKWRSLPQEKQMKLYENTLFPHIKHVMQKFSFQLPKEDLKKFAKEVGKKLVASDFKNGRVEDPTKISDKQEKKVKKYVREYFEKAVEKKRAIDRKKREKAKAQGANGTREDKDSKRNGDVEPESIEAEESKEDVDIEMSDNEEDKDLIASFAQASPSSSPTPTHPSQDLKRKREEELLDTGSEDTESNKRLKEEDNGEAGASPPPPPPPPPSGEMPDAIALQEGEDLSAVPIEEETEEQKQLRQQEEDLMRENEEALMMDLDGTLKVEERDSKLHDHIAIRYPVGDLAGIPPEALNGGKDGGEEGMKVEHERKGVLSH